jgi:alpha-tubulin suppressor-like RCC1 family protein
MPTFNFKDNDGIDIGDKYVTKEYVMDAYPDLVPGFTSGQLYTWGDNYKGQLGTGDTYGRSSPGTTVGTSTMWKDVATSTGQFVAVSAGIKTDGTLWTWGSNGFGAMLGMGAGGASRSSPGTTAGGGTNWKQIDLSAAHAGAVKTDGTLWTWGYNATGQLGDGSTTTASSPITTAGGGTDWKQVSCGYYSTAAIKSDGTLWTWGTNSGGILGDNTTTSRSSPGTTAGGGTNWKQVDIGSGLLAAVKTDGTLWTCGGNGFGQLGTGNTTSRSSPGTVAGGGTTWKQVAANDFNFAAIKTDGTLWTCGYNTQGQLGTGDTYGRSSPGTVAGGGTNWKQVVMAYRNGFAIKTDGSLWTWGDNGYGQLGTNNTTDRSSPGTTVGGGFAWKKVAAAGTISRYRFAVVISDQGGL